MVAHDRDHDLVRKLEKRGIESAGNDEGLLDERDALVGQKGVGLEHAAKAFRGARGAHPSFAFALVDVDDDVGVLEGRFRSRPPARARRTRVPRNGARASLARP